VWQGPEPFEQVELDARNGAVHRLSEIVWDRTPHHDAGRTLSVVGERVFWVTPVQELLGNSVYRVTEVNPVEGSYRKL
jgi:hypothetical protein